ncbi:NAD(P)/FAD-dependent oxidoreductase [Streptomyces galilaeus]
MSIASRPPAALIAGGGPAGAAAAIALARAGCPVHLVEASSYETPRVGEHFPPVVETVLAELGAPEVLRASGAIRCPGVRSRWGDDTEHRRDYLFNPVGGGWNVDRARFDGLLAEHAQSAGARVSLASRFRSITRQGTGWRVSVTGPGGAREISAEVVIDATGRTRSVARRLGARTIAFDQLVGAVAWMDGGADPDQTLLVESCENGWWYSLALPGDRLAGAFMTDADTMRGTSWRSARDWRSFLAEAPATRARLLEQRIRTGPVIRRAHSAVLDRVAAAGWVAVGDAASSVDPLSSDGVARAITSGMSAATAVMRWLDGDTMALEEHGRSVAAGMRRYLAQRAGVYRDESRWTDSEFWRRRHFDSAALLLSPHDMLTLAAPAGLAELAGPAPGLSDVEMGNLIAQCAGPHSAADIVRQFRSSAPHVSDDEVIFALQDLLMRGVIVTTVSAPRRGA